MAAAALNKTLYENVKQDAKTKFKRYPSLYASAWISREYKKRGGKYSGTKKTKRPASRSKGIRRWFDEQWIQVVPYLTKNKIVQCGDDNVDGKACRPLKRINSKSPITIR